MTHFKQKTRNAEPCYVCLWFCRAKDTGFTMLEIIISIDLGAY